GDAICGAEGLDRADWVCGIGRRDRPGVEDGNVDAVAAWLTYNVLAQDPLQFLIDVRWIAERRALGRLVRAEELRRALDRPSAGTASIAPVPGAEEEVGSRGVDAKRSL